MKIFVTLIAVAALVSCDGSSKHSKANPTPRVGAQLSDDYDQKWLREETSDYIKWLVITGPCIDCYYYVTCDHGGKILSVWKK